MGEMSLPQGQTCDKCFAFQFCKGLFGCKPDSTECDYFPVRFKEQPEPPTKQESE